MQNFDRKDPQNVIVVVNIRSPSACLIRSLNQFFQFFEYNYYENQILRQMNPY